MIDFHSSLRGGSFMVYTLFPIVLAGGSGTRLWPISREEVPKQYLNLHSENSLLQETLLRLQLFSDGKPISIVTGQKSGALTFHQGSQVISINQEDIIEEPAARNTAPAIALALLHLLEKGGAQGDDLAFVCPSDHIITNEKSFRVSLEQACVAARQGYIVLFAIPPVRPETGFGYIHRGKEKGCFSLVDRFMEKPDRESALRYMNEGNYYWNGGMFVFRIQAMLSALLEFAPEIGEPASRGYGALLNAFESLPSVSIDKAVIEKSQRLAMVILEAGWSDVGSWDALYEIREKDRAGNVLSGDVMAFDSRNTLLFSRDRLVVGVDLEDLLVVEAADALFVARRGSSQKVRGVVDALKTLRRKEATEAVETVRPWGRYRVLFEGPRFKIKHIVVNPGKRLSLQYHSQRSEHWVVVQGKASVALNGSRLILSEGESTFIPLTVSHRLENREIEPLELIEVQIGEYLGEDDIVRIEDDFARPLS